MMQVWRIPSFNQLYISVLFVTFFIHFINNHYLLRQQFILKAEWKGDDLGDECVEGTLDI